MKSKIVYLSIVFSLLWAILIGRAAYLQFFPQPRLTSLQNRQFQTTVNLQARRGAIVDRKGRDLALANLTYSLYADPKLISNKKYLAKKISPLINENYMSVFKKIKTSEKRFVWLARWLNKDQADKIKKLKIKGVGIIEEWARVYPNDNLLSSVLGFLGNEGQGLEGLELKYNQQLTGESKKITVRRDARGRPLFSDGLLFAEAPEGSQLKLTVDFDLQYKLETELTNVTQQFEAESAVGIILDAKTSAIRAIAATPGYDLNKALKMKPEQRRNKAITDMFEPGSTMKTFVIAGALREKKLKPNSKYFCENGHFVVGDKVIREAETDEKFGDLTASEILAVSSNIGTTKIAFQLTSEKLRQALSDFGFGEKSGVDLPGESKGTVLPLPWRPHMLSNVSFGHAISATPLQMANAYAAIANGGILNTPYIVESLQDPAKNSVPTLQAKVKPIRRVLSAEEALQMRAMLTAATSPGGTGVNAGVDGYLVAGKTGTAQRVNLKSGGYAPGEYISSFAGFIPASDPQFVIYVAILSPKKSYYGSAVAAPLFSKLASYAVRQEGIAPQLVNDKTSPLLAFENSQKKALKKLLDSPDSSLATQGINKMPRLQGLTLREVLRFSQETQKEIRLHGNGDIVDSTWPAEGEEIPDNVPISVFTKSL